MALQPFQVNDGSTIFWDPTSKKIMTEGGKNDSFYKANNINEAQQLWNTRLGNRAASGGGQGQQTASGASGAPTLPSGQPTIDLNKLYESSLNTEDIKKVEADLVTKEALYNKAITSINNNPFASEATRKGNLAKLGDTALRELDSLRGQLSQKKADAQVKLNIATQQYNINNQQYQNELSKLNTLISSGALANAGGNDLAQIAIATGISTPMLTGIVNKMKAGNIKTQVITNTDNRGKVTVSVIDSDTGKVISQNSLGNIDKTSTATAGNAFKPGTPTYIAAINGMSQLLKEQSDSDGRASPQAYVSMRSNWVGQGFEGSDFDVAFKGFINPQHPQDYLVGYSDPSTSESRLRDLLYPKSN